MRARLGRTIPKKRDVLMAKHAEPKKVIRLFVKTLEKLGQNHKSAMTGAVPPPKL